MSSNDYLLADLVRRMNNLVRPGRIHSVDEAKVRARVEIGAIVTDWLPWAVARAGNDRTWWAPTVGEQVVVLSPSGEMNAAFIVASFYTNAFPAPASSADIEHTIYRDGTVVEYDTKAHKLTAKVCGDVVLDITGSLSVTSGSDVTIEASGAVSIKGSSIKLDAPVTATSTVNADDKIKSESDVLAGNISLKSHKHMGVQSGTSSTQGPV